MYKPPEEVIQKAENILSEDFERMNKHNFCYSFRSPLMTSLSFGYCSLLLAFAVCSFDSVHGIHIVNGTLTVNGNVYDSIVVLGDSPGWLWYFFAGVIVVTAANSGVVFISLSWTIFILTLIVFTFLCIILALPVYIIAINILPVIAVVVWAVYLSFKCFVALVDFCIRIFKCVFCCKYPLYDDTECQCL